MIAPCGVICELCIGYQRKKNKCVGCNAEGNKPKHCTICSIKNCLEKSTQDELCYECHKYPCRRLKDLEKRYSGKYGESPTENMKIAVEKGLVKLSEEMFTKWACTNCGNLLSVHRDICVICGATNKNFSVSST